MKNFVKKVLIIVSAYCAFLASWIIIMSSSGPAIENLTQYETIYAAPIVIAPTIRWDTDVTALHAAENHMEFTYNDLEEMVTQAYFLGNHLWLEYGVSTWNCTDHDHLSAITSSNGVSAVGWDHDVGWDGTIWFQIVTQCEWNQGAYWKGEKWYPRLEYPTDPESNIWLDMAFLTTCQYPYQIDPSADEYGCGEEDIQ